MGSKKKEEKEKPLEKMTAKELREVASKFPEITGVHAMNKEELLAGIKKSKGIADDSSKKEKTSVRELKKKMKVLRTKREEALKGDNVKMAKVYRKQLSKIKKRTRQSA